MYNMEIIIPTWNRCEYLDRTLSQFAESPFSNNKITIIDNNSTDNTPEICEKYKKVFPNLKIVRNNKNIGLSANILRCFEFAEEKYLWLLGDNDNYDFSDCSELIDVLENSDFDLIIVENVMNIECPQITNTQEIFDDGNGNEIFHQFATLATYIIKTDLITEEAIQKGYTIAEYLYPQISFVINACDKNSSIYILNKKIRIGDSNPHVSYNTLDLVNGWVSSFLEFEKKYRNEGIRCYLSHKPLWFSLFGSIIAVKARKIPNYRKTLNNLIISVIRAKGVIGLIYAFIMLILSLIPSKICEYILNKFYEIYE